MSRSTRCLLLGVVCVAVLAVFAGPAAAVTTGGGHWTWQSPLPSGQYLSDTSFIGNEGWAVTGSPDVMHTSDGGATWQSQATGEDDSLYAVEFVSATEGWAAGDWGCVLHTTDGGATWTRQISGTLDTIMQIDFPDAGHGWLVGYGSVTATADGGDTWVVQLGGMSSFYEWWYGWYPSGVSYEAVAFADAQHGVVVGSKALRRQAEDYAGVVWTTADGGATWTETQVEGVQGFGAVTTQGGKYYAAGSDNAIAHTDDGVTWTRDTESAPVSLYDIDMTPGGGGWAVGYGDGSDWYSYSDTSSGILLHTTDGGATWSPVADPVFGADTLIDVAFSDAANGRIVGSSGAIYVTVDGGATWATVGPKREAVINFTAITRSPDGLLWVVGTSGSYAEDGSGDGVVWCSDDGGATWEDTGDEVTAYAGLSQVYAAAGGVAWVAGQGGRILHTTDGGATWKQQATGIASAITGIAFTDATHGWAISSGLRGVVLKTTDGGAHWALTRVANLERFMAVQADGTDIWLGGMAYRSECEEHGSGVVWHSTDGGTTWAPPVTAADRAILQLVFASDTEAWALSGTPYWMDSRQLLHSTDGGANWTSVTAADRAILQLAFPSGAEAWALSGTPYWMDSRQLLHSADGGATWAPVDLRGSGVSGVSSMWFAGADEGWLLGQSEDYYGSVMLHTVDGGAHWGAVSIPETWSLSALAFSGTEDGWMVGGESTILATRDGGGIAPISVSNADGRVRWEHKPFTLKVKTLDDGLGLAPTLMRAGDGAWEAKSSVVVAAPRSHANDGYHVFRYRGVDLQGNKGAAKTVLVAIDTRPPSFVSHDKAKAQTMRRGSLRLKASDSFSPWVRVYLDAYSASGKRVRMRSSARADGEWHAVRYICRLQPGTYRLVVSVKDIAGNPSARSHTLSLIVKR